jgi:hypothetical protein
LIVADLLAIYLNDHLAGATGGLELAKRAAGSNRGSEVGEFLRRLREEIEEDRASLIEAMRRLDVGRDRAKVAAGWAAEKAGRLKLNGRLVGYSPLSRVVELEVLALGVGAKLSCWRALAELGDARLHDVGLPALIERAERQRDELERFRLASAREVLSKRG